MDWYLQSKGTSKILYNVYFKLTSKKFAQKKPPLQEALEYKIFGKLLFEFRVFVLEFVDTSGSIQ